MKQLSESPEIYMPIETPRILPWHELAVLAMAGMEMSWVALWFRILSKTGQYVSYWGAFWILGGMMVGAYILAYILNALRIKVLIRRILLGVGLLMGILIGLKLLVPSPEDVRYLEDLTNTLRALSVPNLVMPAEFAITVAILWVWWRGVTLAGKEVEVYSVKRAFILGLVMLVAYGLVAPLTGEIPTLAVYIFLFCWLLAMVFTRLHTLGLLEKGRSVKLNKEWLAGIFLSVVGVLGLAVTTVFLLNWRLSTWIVNSFLFVLKAVFGLLIVIFAPIFVFIIWALTSLGEATQDAIIDFQGMSDFMVKAEMLLKSLQNDEDPDALLRFFAMIKPYLVWGIVLMGVIIILWSLRERRGRAGFPHLTDEEGHLEQEGALKKLRDSLRSGTEFLSNLWEGVIRLGNPGRILAAARIRRVYTQLMHLSASLGLPRKAKQTPLEFLPDLQNLFSQSAPDLSMITEAYNRVRYGEYPESMAEAEEVEDAWRRVSVQGRDLSRNISQKK